MVAILSMQSLVLVLVFLLVQINKICDSSGAGAEISSYGRPRYVRSVTVTGDDIEPNAENIEASFVFLNKNNLTLQIEEELGLVLNPSDTCKIAVQKFGEAVSNFTLCSVTNARPIHVCGLCVGQYMNVLSSHKDFISKIDELGTECSEYYLNRDRIEIVSAAYHYVKSLWKEGNCDNCFEKDAAGKLVPQLTNDTQRFEESYNLVRECFDVFSNGSCEDCKPYYKDMNDIYVIIRDTTDDNICLDIVDTMNTTREMWSRVYHCMPVRRIEFGIIFGISLVALIPLVFYPMAFALSKKQHADVLKQKRMAVLAEIFGFHGSQSSASIDVVGGSQTLHPPASASEIPAVFLPSTSSQLASMSRRRATAGF